MTKPSKLLRVISHFIKTEVNENTGPPDSFLLDNLPHIVFQLDAEYRWVLLNPCWEQVSGFQRKESLNRKYQEFIHPDDREHLHDYFIKMQPGRRNNDPVEARLLTQRSDPRWTEFYAVQIISSKGQPVIIGTITDISERIAEEELLHANNRSLSGLLNDLSGMVYRCRNDKYWTMEYISGGCKDLTGYMPADMINNSKVSWDSLIHPDDHDQVWAEVQNGVRESRHYDMTFRMHTIDNKLKWVWERGKGIFSDDGELLGLEGVITDITESKLRQDRIEKCHLYDPLYGFTQLPLFKDRLTRSILASQLLEGFEFNLLIIQFHRLANELERRSTDFADVVSKTISTRLSRTLSNLDSLTSLKPDRYAILIERPIELNSLQSIANQLLEIFRSPVHYEDQTLFLTCSIGASNSRDNNHSVEAIMNTALVAMDYASAQGGARFERYDPEITTY